jgi:hypothetical protein
MECHEEEATALAAEIDCVPLTVGIPLSDYEFAMDEDFQRQWLGENQEVEIHPSTPRVTATATATATAAATAMTAVGYAIPTEIIASSPYDGEESEQEELYCDFDLMGILAESPHMFDQQNLIADDDALGDEQPPSNSGEPIAPVALPIVSLSTAPITYAVPKEQYYCYGQEDQIKDGDGDATLLPDHCVEAVATYCNPAANAAFAEQVVAHPATATATATTSTVVASAATATTTATPAVAINHERDSNNPVIGFDFEADYGIFDMSFHPNIHSNLDSYPWISPYSVPAQSSTLIDLKPKIPTLFTGSGMMPLHTAFTSSVHSKVRVPQTTTTMACSMIKWKEERRQQSILRWKAKRLRRIEREAEEAKELKAPVNSNKTKKKSVNTLSQEESIKSLTARQQATAKRVRDGGKFKKTQIKWTSVTELSK